MAISFEFFTKERADKLVRHHDALIPLFNQIYDNERVCDVAFGLDMPEASFDKSDIESEMNDADYVVLMFDDGKVIGFMLADQGEYGYIPDSTYIEYCVILQEYRGRGLGTEMMKFFKRSIGRTGIRHVLLHVNAANPNAEKLYAKSGFSKVGTVMALNI